MYIISILTIYYQQMYSTASVISCIILLPISSISLSLFHPGYTCTTDIISTDAIFTIYNNKCCCYYFYYKSVVVCRQRLQIVNMVEAVVTIEIYIWIYCRARLRAEGTRSVLDLICPWTVFPFENFSHFEWWIFETFKV